MSTTLESRVTRLESDLTTLAECGTLDPDHDRALRLDADDPFGFGAVEGLAEAMEFPPAPHESFGQRRARELMDSIHELAAHAAAWVPGGEG